MTNKEIAKWLNRSRNWSFTARSEAQRGRSFTAFDCAELSVSIIHHIINSINWED